MSQETQLLSALVQAVDNVFPDLHYHATDAEQKRLAPKVAALEQALQEAEALLQILREC